MPIKPRMRTLLGGGVWAVTAMLAAAGGAPAQAPAAHPQIVTPASGSARPADVGRRAHTNVELFVPPGGYQAAAVRPAVGPPVSGSLTETPASVACAYGVVLDSPPLGCNPYKIFANPTGGSRAIAIVDAYDYPTASSDLAAFDSQFGVTAANFTVIYGTGNPSAGCANGTRPPGGSGSGWDLEAALDIEWAHAMAPSAKLYLVEANSDSNTDLFNAEQVAAKCVQLSQYGQVSNSWGSAEFSGEASSDSVFTASGVVYFFAAGDDVGVSYPAASPNVIGVGGSAFSRNQITGGYLSQANWGNEDLYLNTGSALGTGGGPSAYEPRPSYQNPVQGLVGAARGTPDLGAIADPATPVWVYNTTYCSGWCGVGGTSAATPITAGIFNQLGLFYGSSNAALTAIYNNNGSVRTTSVTPILNGDCGPPGEVLGSSYSGSYGQPYNPSWNQAIFGFAYNYCTGWGNIGVVGRY